MTARDLLHLEVPDDLIGIVFVLFGAVFLLWGADLIRDSWEAVDRRWPPPRTFQWHLGLLLIGFWCPLCLILGHGLLVQPAGTPLGWVLVVAGWGYLVLRGYLALAFYRDETETATEAEEEEAR